MRTGLIQLIVKNIADPKPIDPFVSTEDAVEVDAAAAAAIKDGFRDAKEGRVVSSEEVRRLIPKWISKFSTRTAH